METERHRRELELAELEMQLRRQDLHRKELELQIAELELEKRRSAMAAERHEAALTGIKMASRFMDPQGATKFLEMLAQQVEEPVLRDKLRLQIADLYFGLDRPDAAAEQLRTLILESHGHD
jgi:hypothetical protein